MKTLMTISVAAALLLAAGAAAGASPALETRQKMGPAATNVALDVISDWPDGSRDLAGALIDEYGAPDEIETSRLTWKSSPPWKKMTVFRDATDRGHPDSLLRTVAYRVPVERWRALEAFGHGVEYDPVSEQLSARTDNEDTNYLALNLADEVVRGVLSSAEASALYDKTMVLLISGKSSSNTSRLLFKAD